MDKKGFIPADRPYLQAIADDPIHAAPYLAYAKRLKKRGAVELAEYIKGAVVMFTSPQYVNLIADQMEIARLSRGERWLSHFSCPEPMWFDFWRGVPILRMKDLGAVSQFDPQSAKASGLFALEADTNQGINLDQPLDLSWLRTLRLKCKDGCPLTLPMAEWLAKSIGDDGLRLLRVYRSSSEALKTMAAWPAFQKLRSLDVLERENPLFPGLWDLLQQQRSLTELGVGVDQISPAEAQDFFAADFMTRLEKLILCGRSQAGSPLYGQKPPNHVKCLMDCRDAAGVESFEEGLKRTRANFSSP
jgi:hypothetical protein